VKHKPSRMPGGCLQQYAKTHCDIKLPIKQLNLDNTPSNPILIILLFKNILQDLHKTQRQGLCVFVLHT